MGLAVPGIVGKSVGAVVVPGVLVKLSGIGLSSAVAPFIRLFSLEPRDCVQDAENRERTFVAEPRDHVQDAENRKRTFVAEPRDCAADTESREYEIPPQDQEGDFSS